ncbi:hypothetical protein PM082_020186 [Marasmius tenuissimus]|nr:hypothetical protein PM082_020186 [Marasmius tenuissimus]
MSTALDQQQVEEHRQKLASFTDFRVFPVLAETVLYAIFTVLIITSSYILLTRGRGSRYTRMMLATTIILYGLSTWDWAIDILLLRDDLKVFLPADLIQPSPNHVRRIQVNNALHISQSIMNNISTMLSDSVVVWRVYVVFGRDKRVLAIGVALLTALFSPAELVIDIVTLSLSALVNIWATGMIAYQAWRYRREIKVYLRDSTTRSFAESMLILFTETGAVYTSLWILRNIIVIHQLVKTPYTTYANQIMYQITGMYPTIIIILVALQKSHLETQFTSYGGVSTQRDMGSGSGPTSTTAVSSRIRAQLTRDTSVLASTNLSKVLPESRSDLRDISGKGDSSEFIV